MPDLPLVEGLPHTADRGHPVAEHRLELGRHHLVGLAEHGRRRSEWPTITYSTWSLASISGLTSPVNAPVSSMAQFWAPRDTGMPSGSMTDCTVRMSVNGGWTETSTAGDVGRLQPETEVPRGVQRLEVVEVHLPVAADQRPAPGCAAHRVGALAVRGSWHDRCVGRAPQRGQPGQVAVLEQFERRSAAGGDEADLARSRPSSSTAAALSPPPTTV